MDNPYTRGCPSPYSAIHDILFSPCRKDDPDLKSFYTIYFNFLFQPGDLYYTYRIKTIIVIIIIIVVIEYLQFDSPII